MEKGSLTVVGTGIQAIRQTTLEVVHEIQHAEKLLYLAGDTVTAAWLHELNPTAESLYSNYVEGRHRQLTYDEWVERILIYVRSELRVCVAFYGHPGVFVVSGHEAVRRATQEGYSAKMLPGISSEDCLFSDLGIDPASNGCQSYEATDFLLVERRIDPRSSLILWQIGMLGQRDYRNSFSTAGIPLLVDFLQIYYGSDHIVTLYEAAVYPICSPRIENVCLAHLADVQIKRYSTLYVPPLFKGEVNIGLSNQLAELVHHPTSKPDSKLDKQYKSTSSTIFEDILLPDGWSNVLRKTGFFTLNVGYLSDSNLKLLGFEIARLDQNLTVSEMTLIEEHQTTEYRALSSQSVPFHNEGIYYNSPPRYLLLYCVAPADDGGETLLLRGDSVVDCMNSKLRQFLQETPVCIRVGNHTATRNLLVQYPGNSEQVLFFIDPQTTNNCTLTIDGCLLDNSVLAELRALLMEPSMIYHCQKWQAHDLLIIDNYKILHGRTAYQGHRLLKRVLISPVS
jgi:alpha-ketoglutarate-dependent taurine dioxygenase/precorrin-6B methylase 1